MDTEQARVSADWALHANIEGVVDWIERFETWGALHPNTHRDAIPFLYPPDKHRADGYIEPSRGAAWRWYIEGFSGDEARAWVEVGLPPEGADLARELRTAHVPRERAHEVITHPITRQPSTVMGVANTAYQHFATVGEALDAAGYVA